MSREQVPAVNVTDALRTTELVANQRRLLLLVGGYMVENHKRLRNVGVDLQHPDRTDWANVYKKVGGY